MKTEETLFGEFRNSVDEAATALADARAYRQLATARKRSLGSLYWPVWNKLVQTARRRQ